MLNGFKERLDDLWQGFLVFNHLEHVIRSDEYTEEEKAQAWLEVESWGPGYREVMEDVLQGVSNEEFFYQGGPDGGR